jgi:hypothetical protein
MPYRDLEALRARHSTLLRRLGEIEAQTRDIEALRREEAAVRRALADTAALLESAAPKRALPLLGSVGVASPCSASWQGMSGDDRKRFCGKCEKNVYNLSAMTAEEAEAFLRENEGADVCIRLYKRADGTVLTSDCPVGVRRKRVARIAAVAVGAGALAAAGAALLSVATKQGKMACARPGSVDHGQVSESGGTPPPPVVFMGRRAPPK